MGKNDDIQELTNLMSKALRHKIGSIVNKDEFYSAKYARDSDIIMKEAEKVLLRQNWNNYDKAKIREQLRLKLRKELEDKDFLKEEKFEIMDSEINAALEEFEL